MSSRAAEECKKVRVLEYLLERAVEKSLKTGKKRSFMDGHELASNLLSYYSFYIMQSVIYNQQAWRMSDADFDSVPLRFL